MFERKINLGFTLVEIMIVVAIVALLAAISVPGLLRARVTANESHAQATLRAITDGNETYAAANNGSYADSIAALTGTTPPYLSEDYTATVRYGYNFACDAMSFTGYSCTAVPATCNLTGNRNFTITTGAVFTSSDCS